MELNAMVGVVIFHREDASFRQQTTQAETVIPGPRSDTCKYEMRMFMGALLIVQTRCWCFALVRGEDERRFYEIGNSTYIRVRKENNVGTIHLIQEDAT